MKTYRVIRFYENGIRSVVDDFIKKGDAKKELKRLQKEMPKAEFYIDHNGWINDNYMSELGDKLVGLLEYKTEIK